MASESEANEGLPLGDYLPNLIRAIELLSGRPKQCARNSIKCLKRAWLLRDLDPEMAVFRAITAEEEAATALMFALKHRGYPLSEKLLPHDHNQKSAWMPFIEVIGKLFGESGVPKPRITLKFSVEARVDVSISAKALNIQGAKEGDFLSPDEPLNMTIRSSKIGSDDAEIHTFEEDLMNWANEKGAKSIRDYIAEAANIRNLVLYAQDRGIPKCEHVDGFIIERRRRVVVLLFAVIMVLQARQPQAFAAQALEAFLRVMRGVTQAGFDFASAEGGGRFKVITHLDPDGAQHISQIHAAESFYTFESRFSYKWSRGWSFGP